MRVEGADLYAEWTGEGPALVFMHAGIADSRMWDPHFAAFSARHRVLRFDTRGFGRSPMPSGRFAYHDDVAGVMRAAGLDRATLIGCSFGGNIAVETCLAHPELVERLALVAPGLGVGEDDPEMRRFAEEEEAALERGDLDAATEINLRFWVDGPARAPEQVNPDVRERVRSMQLDAFRVPMPEGIERIRLEPPASARLAEILVPTLILVGALDVPAIREASARIEREVPGARRIVVEDAAHMVSMERPAEFQRAVEAFLNG